MTKPITYSDAGVSIDRANAAVEQIKRLARGTFGARTLSEIGSLRRDVRRRVPCA